MAHIAFEAEFEASKTRAVIASMIVVGVGLGGAARAPRGAWCGQRLMSTRRECIFGLAIALLGWIDGEYLRGP